MQESTFRSAFYPLWLVYLIVPLAAGLDKFFYLLVEWDRYIAPVALRLMPFSGETFMYIVGVIELAVGVLALTRYRRLAAYITSAWLLAITLNLLLLGGFYDIAVRDLSMAVGAFTLAQLLAMKGEAVLPGLAPAAAEQIAGERHRVQPA